MNEAESIAAIERLNDAWNELAQTFRHACVLYRQGRRSEAMHIVSEVLPEPLQRWSAACDESSASKRRQLLALFSEEAQRIGDSALMQQLFHAHLIDRSQALAGARAALLSRQGLQGGIRRRNAEAEEPTERNTAAAQFASA